MLEGSRVFGMGLCKRYYGNPGMVRPKSITPKRLQEPAELELTHDLIEAGQTPRGAWTAAQLAELGVAWPPRRGWKERLVGTSISLAAYGRFLEAADWRRSKSGKTVYRPQRPGLFR